MIKPDGIKRGLIGSIISRYESKTLKILDCQMVRAKKDQLERHYAEHIGKDFFVNLITFMMSGPIIIMLLEGENAISVVRKLHGATDPKDADPGTIRGDYAYHTTENLVHASDSKESVEREIKIWLKKEF